MMLLSILAVLFAGISLLVYALVRGTSDAWDHYSPELSASTETSLRKLYVFADARRLLIVYIAILMAVLAGMLFLQVNLLIAFLVVAGVAVSPYCALALLAQRRQQQINAALPDALGQIAGAMRAGSTFTLAVQAFVDENQNPLGQELSFVLKEQRLGVRLDDALENLAERVQTEEMDLVVSATLIALEVGGNLAEILSSLADTIRRKLDMEGKVKSLTAQGRLQGRVVTALPFLILLILAVIEEEATRPMFTSLLGWIFLSVMVLLQVIGGLMIRKIVNIDI